MRLTHTFRDIDMPAHLRSQKEQWNWLRKHLKNQKLNAPLTNSTRLNAQLMSPIPTTAVKKTLCDIKKSLTFTKKHRLNKTRTNGMMSFNYLKRSFMR